MANNVTNTNTFAPPPPSQVEAQSIAGQPPVQVRPQSTTVNGNTISGAASPYTYNQNKGKGNNSEK